MAITYKHADKEVQNEGTCHEKVRHTHPAFGRITVTKQMGGHRRLFGSALAHDQAICLRLETASVDRHLAMDWVHGEKIITEFLMSEAQWAQMVSSIGCGTGTPVTLRYAPEAGYKLETLPEILLDPVKEATNKEFEQYCAKLIAGGKDISKRLDEALESSLSKKELKQIAANLNNFLGNMPVNMGFMQDQFKEAVEKIVSDASIEIETKLGNLAMATGIDLLKSKYPLLGGMEGDKITPLKQIESIHAPANDQTGSSIAGTTQP